MSMVDTSSKNFSKDQGGAWERSSILLFENCIYEVPTLLNLYHPVGKEIHQTSPACCLERALVGSIIVILQNFRSFERVKHIKLGVHKEI